VLEVQAITLAYLPKSKSIIVRSSDSVTPPLPTSLLGEELVRNSLRLW